MLRHRTTAADPPETLRAWRLAANHFYVEAAECREALRTLDARTREGASRGELVQVMLRERARVAVACRELLAGFDQLRSGVRRASEDASAREREAVQRLRRRVATYIRRRTRHA